MLGDFHDQMKLRIIEKSYRNVINNQEMFAEQLIIIFKNLYCQFWKLDPKKACAQSTENLKVS